MAPWQRLGRADGGGRRGGLRASCAHRKRRAAASWDVWLFSRRNAILAAIPFALVGAWTSYLITIFVYAAASFFALQHLRDLPPELTRS